MVINNLQVIRMPYVMAQMTVQGLIKTLPGNLFPEIKNLPCTVAVAGTGKKDEDMMQNLQEQVFAFQENREFVEVHQLMGDLISGFDSDRNLILGVVTLDKYTENPEVDIYTDQIWNYGGTSYSLKDPQQCFLEDMLTDTEATEVETLHTGKSNVMHPYYDNGDFFIPVNKELFKQISDNEIKSFTISHILETSELIGKCPRSIVFLEHGHKTVDYFDIDCVNLYQNWCRREIVSCSVQGKYAMHLLSSFFDKDENVRIEDDFFENYTSEITLTLK